MTDALRLPTTLTLGEARATLAEIAPRLAAAPEPVVDASGLDELDSSALAVLLECQRQVTAKGRRLRIEQPPAKLSQLARLYGVSDLLGLPAGAKPAASDGS